MTREEAVDRAAALNARASSDEHWLVQPGNDGWAVVRLRGAGLGLQEASGAHTESRPRPEQPADPRPALIRNVPPYGA